MKLKEAIDILKKHNKWRRDKNVPPKIKMQNPVKLGQAIDVVVKEYEND